MRLLTRRYANAPKLFITADAGGSNGYRSRVWKAELQRLADKIGISIHVSHFPPGTSKWNKIERRLFSFITINWRGRSEHVLSDADCAGQQRIRFSTSS